MTLRSRTIRRKRAIPLLYRVRENARPDPRRVAERKILWGDRGAPLRQLEEDRGERGTPDLTVVPRYFDIQGEIPTSVSDFFASVSRLMVKGTGIAPWEGTSNGQAYQAFLKYLEQASPQMEKAYGANWLVVLLIDELDVAAGRLPSDECFHNLRPVTATIA